MGDIHVPLVGNAWFIGLVALLHFALVSMGGLAPLVIYLAEGSARKRGNAHLNRLIHEFLTLALEIQVVGGILGSGIVVALIGLRPQVLTLVVNLFFWFVVLQLFAFIIGLGFLFAYYFTWSKAQSRHRLWGLIGAILLLVPYVVFSAAAGFLNNPGSWPESGSLWAAVFNPVTVPSLLHRAAAGLSMIGVLIVAIYALRRRGKTGEERAYLDYAVGWGSRLALHALEAQVILGVVRILVMRPEGQRMIMGGSLTGLWIAGIVLGVAAWVFLRVSRRRPALQARDVIALAIVPVLGSLWLMGATRSLERGEFSIAGVMDRQDEIVQLPESYQVADEVSGEMVFQTGCGGCHPGAAGDALALARERHPDPASLAAFLRDPASAGVAMPPFGGSGDELTGLVAYLLDLPVDEVALGPEVTGPGAEEPAAEVEPLSLGEYIVLAWNDLGMHCFMGDYSSFAVLPPANTLWAQVIRRGVEPEVMPAGLTAEYSFPEITDPVPHTNFWDYAPAYGWDLEPGIGLAGFGVAGEMHDKADHFVAELVPIVDTNDSGLWDPFPMFDVDVQDASGRTVAQTRNVAPVSSEMSCDICHSGGPASELRVTMENILQLHDQKVGTSLLESAQAGKPRLCASCHASPALGIMENQGASTTFSTAMHGAHADRMDRGGVPENICWACHPGPRTQCQRGAMSQVGITCIDCHGGMAEVGDASRTSWINLPQCETCHTSELGRASLLHIAEPNQHLTWSFGVLYRNRTAHGGIYCAACHGSPHAIYPSRNERDNEQALLLQGQAGIIGTNCTVCHAEQPEAPFWHFQPAEQ
jgi:mono/diheme cytochrome c family protein